MTADELKGILDAHAKWTRDEAGGVRADLSHANLSSANLSRANLYNANLSGANPSRASMSGANLYNANLSNANLSSANLYNANLSSANLSRANLYNANLTGANLRGAYLRGAYLTGANLTGANLRGAYLRGANLTGANLTGAYLTDADLRDAILDEQPKGLHMIVPEMGSFIGFKRLRGKSIACLRIPDDADRVGGWVGRKCRASHAEVLEIRDAEGNACKFGQALWQGSSRPFTYHVGRTVIAKDYDPDPRVECAGGIHFFLTLREAKEYR